VRKPFQQTMSPRWRALIIAIIAYFMIRAIAEGFGLRRYRWFSEPLDVTRLLIDLAVWTVIYLTVHWLIVRRGRADVGGRARQP
jgi:hypothetical protein